MPALKLDDGGELHAEEIDDGVVTRSDQTAAIVRRITAAAGVPR